MDRDRWSQFANSIVPHLDQDDDRGLWQEAIQTLLVDTDAEAAAYAGKDCLIVEIGRCSHWIRPHWKAHGGMSYPFGYGNVGGGFAFGSLPQFDWSLKWARLPDANDWQPAAGQPTRRLLVRRVTIPARTARHPKATVHAIWTPGSPGDPKRKLTTLYGFERSDNGWRLFAEWDRRHG